ncbi:hypothetical protein [Bacillus sp. FJAT-49736]|uniref:hypothetical protein n=1 Tax=Bacillus sp. FJAT-49736 TaxID=2833582 RepID=UPI001BCA0BEC|nr:hypothetical protein [Bacillus sp. FJAT-49736]MBS4174295.1 hypothetical protein [Bacillus sp. FJAT-49736]
MELKEVVKRRNALAEQEKKIYLNAVTQLNTRSKDLLTNNFGTQLVHASVRDLSGQVVRRFFNLGDLYITADQLAKRIVQFDYKNEYDPLAGNKEYQKEVYNYNDRDSKYYNSTLKSINERSAASVKAFHEGDRKAEHYYDQNGTEYTSRTVYKTNAIDPDSDYMKDDLTGRKVRKETIQGDHVRAVKSATYNERYLGEGYRQEMEKAYNSVENMQWIDGRANIVKGAAATPEETIQKWENEDSVARDHLMKMGYLNEEGKVPKHVKKELEKNYRHIGNVESRAALKHANYKKMGSDAAKDTGKAVGKIITGQLIYYTLPPLVYETKTIIKNRHITLETFFPEIKKASKRVIQYVSSKLKQILINLSNNVVKKFLKSFFDILLSILKSTVKKVMGLVKDLVLAVVDSMKILFNKSATKAQKADAVFNLVSVTVTNAVVQALIEYISKQLGLPDFVTEVIELLAIVITSNIVMLILQKVDLFDVRYGILVANLEKVFKETSETYDRELQLVEEATDLEVRNILDKASKEIDSLEERLADFDVYADSATEHLDRVNKMFNMNIDFENEWLQFMAVAHTS